jgi:hypothetical protein
MLDFRSAENVLEVSLAAGHCCFCDAISLLLFSRFLRFMLQDDALDVVHCWPNAITMISSWHLCSRVKQWKGVAVGVGGGMGKKQENAAFDKMNLRGCGSSVKVHFRTDYRFSLIKYTQRLRMKCFKTGFLSIKSICKILGSKLRMPLSRCSSDPSAPLPPPPNLPPITF